MPLGSTELLRDGIVASAIEFLRHPSIAKADIEHKVEFLKKRGLKSNEVQEAISRAKKPLQFFQQTIKPEIAKALTPLQPTTPGNGNLWPLDVLVKAIHKLPIVVKVLLGGGAGLVVWKTLSAFTCSIDLPVRI